MKQKQERFTHDVLFVAFSIVVAVYLVESGWANSLLDLFDGHVYLGSFLAGALFTSIFTTAPAVAFLIELAPRMPLIPLVLIGSAGATIVDHLLFHLVRDRVTDDAKYLMNAPPTKQLMHIMRRRRFHRFFPLIGALLLASPLPDEPAILFLGLSGLSTRAFLALSFVTHALGIWLTVAAAKAVGG